MLDYEWGNPSTIILSGNDPAQEPDPNSHIFEHYNNTQPFNDHLVPQPITTTSSFFHHQTPSSSHSHQLNSLYDPRAYASSAAAATHPSLLSLDPLHSPSYFLIPKTEEVTRSSADFAAARIGLNLGGRTYFSSAEDDFVNRLYRRSRPMEPGSSNGPRCQAEGCNADLTLAKHYHRRHKVCEFHSKASTVIAAGLTQRFCQQCSRFHLLAEFDNGKRSCRRRLADHNRRRRKSHHTNQESQKSQVENARDSSSENHLTRSPQDSGAQSSSTSVRVAVSPPRMSLDCFKQRPYMATASSSSSASSSSLFFLTG